MEKTTTPQPANSSPRSPRKARASDGSREGKRRAAAILEVLAGVRTPGDAADALAISTQRYYLLENQALAGLVAACEPKTKGSSASPQREIERLRREVQRLENEVRRQQALARTAQRAVGLTTPATSKAKPKGKDGQRKRRPRKPAVRALKAAKRLQSEPAEGQADS